MSGPIIRRNIIAMPASKALSGKSFAHQKVMPKAMPQQHEPQAVRLSKVMADRGMCSRREADIYIEKGLVFVDGERVSLLGSRINPNANITLSQQASDHQARLVTIILHKPIGYVSGQPEPGFIPAMSLITAKTQYQSAPAHHKTRVSPSHDTVQTNEVTMAKSRAKPLFIPKYHPSIFTGLAPAGRLDIDSTGLLVFTQDGRIARHLIGDDSQVEKEYLVRVDRLPNHIELQRLNFGLSLDGQQLRPAKVEVLNDGQLRFILREGRKRQIRRMCEIVNVQVLALKRVRIGRIKLGHLPMGQWRFLMDNERF